jgi:5-methylcytosine-specific restriction endonuclease McrA
MRYREYLRSDRWKKQRKRTFQNHGRRCVVCGSEKVEVHHLTYKSLGNEDPKKHLLPLCREHHQQVHIYAEERRMHVWNATHLLTKEYRSKSNPRHLTWNEMTPFQREQFIGVDYTRLLRRQQKPI